MRSEELLFRTLSTTGSGRELARRLKEGDPRTHGNVMITITTEIAPYETIAAAWHQAHLDGRRLSLRDWATGHYVLHLGTVTSAKEPLEAINRAVLEYVTGLLLHNDRTGADPSWIFLDEFRALGNVARLTDLLTLGRSKGCCVVLGFQDLCGLYDAFGENRAKEILAQVGSKAIFRLETAEAARAASDLLAEEEIKQKTKSEGSGNTTIQETVPSERKNVLPSEFMDLPMPDQDPEGRLVGYYITRESGAYRGVIEKVFSQLTPPDEGVPAYVERPASHQELREFEPGEALPGLLTLGTRSDYGPTNEPPSDGGLERGPQRNPLDGDW